jgi:hypothetical protein
MPSAPKLLSWSLLLLPGLALAQDKARPSQPVKPPIAQAWVDLATHQSDLPAMANVLGQAMNGGGLASLGGLFGRSDKGRGNTFGQTGQMSFSGSGQFMDVSVTTRNNRALSDAQQLVPQGSMLSPSLQLIAPVPDKPVESTPTERDDEPREQNYERPKGKMLLYWGCGEAVRPGQPRVLDFANMNMADVQKIMIARGSTPKGARSLPGMPAWPNKQDDRKVPTGAQVAGEHTFMGNGIPGGFRFQLRPDVDFMPALTLNRQSSPTGALLLDWTALPQARGYFISAMGGRPGASRDDGAEMVMWTSSELPDTGFGLVDYQTPSGLDRFVKDKVVLPPAATHCAVPSGIFGSEANGGAGAGAGAGMLRMIAYGPEQWSAYPPRPADPKATWEPDWQVRVRTKSTVFAMMMPGGAGGAPGSGEKDAPPSEEKKKPKVTDLLKGLLGR